MSASEDPEALYDDKNLKASTLKALISKLTCNDVENGFIHDCLLTYRSFTTPLQFLHELTERYRNASNEDAEMQRVVTLRVFNVLKLWIERYWYDFEKDSSGLQEGVTTFLTSTKDLPISATIKSIFERQLSGKENITSSEVIPPLYVPTKPTETLWEMKTNEIARQLTMVEWNIWKLIQPWECLNLAWTRKETAKTEAPNVLAMIERFNYVSGWVATTICNTEKTKDRVKIMRKFINIAKDLHSIGNFNGVMEIISGLNRGPVYRLKGTTSVLAEKHKITYGHWQELITLTDATKSYANLRKALREVDPPCLPYLGMYLTDINFIEDGNKNTFPGTKLINISKRRMIAETLKDIRQYQQKSYNFAEVPEIKAKLFDEQVLEDKDLYLLSNWVQPPPGTERGKKPEFNTQSKPQITKFDLDFVKEWQVYYVADHPGNIILDPVEPNTIQSGTIPKIIEKITHPYEPDGRSMPALLTVYRSYISSSELLDLVITRYRYLPLPKNKSEENMALYDKDMKAPIFLRVVNILKHWIVHYWGDFEKEESLKQKLLEFLDFLKEDKSSLPSADVLVKAIEKQEEFHKNKLELMTEKIVPKSLQIPSKQSILSFDVPILANQLTLFSWRCFVKVTADEFLHPNTSMNVRTLLAHSIALERYFSQEIRNCVKEGKEIQLLKHLLQVIRVWKLSYNWCCIYSVLESIRKNIVGLRTAWEVIPPQDKKFYIETCKLLADPSSIALPKNVSFFLPEVKSFLNKLALIESQHTEIPPQGHINMVKQRALSGVLSNWIKLMHPDIVPDHSIQLFLAEKIVPDPQLNPEPEIDSGDIHDLIFGEQEESFTLLRQTFFDMAKNDPKLKSTLYEIIDESVDNNVPILATTLKERINSSIRVTAGTQASANKPAQTPAKQIAGARHSPSAASIPFRSPSGKAENALFNSSILKSLPKMGKKASKNSMVVTYRSSYDTPAPESGRKYSTTENSRIIYGDIYTEPKTTETLHNLYSSEVELFTLPDTDGNISGQPGIIHIPYVTLNKAKNIILAFNNVEPSDIKNFLKVGKLFSKKQIDFTVGCAVLCNTIAPLARDLARNAKIKVYTIEKEM